MRDTYSLEIKKFEKLASQWWDQSGAFRTLHDLNPLRLQYIDRFAAIAHQYVVDVGCGGGILAEGMATLGAKVTGIDLSKQSIHVAKQHSLKSNLAIDYRYISAKALAQQKPHFFDVVVCMEMLEHVTQPLEIIRAIARLIKPNGWVFFSTINRNMRSYIRAVLIAEYLLNLLPRGTHSYENFIKPSELVHMTQQATSLQLVDLSGVSYNPFLRRAYLTVNATVNYIAAFQNRC
jgi:2-polyprenyl-6-hydroxyphenyl methylase/3-demethylubiquinone-9 3-methyltransferase